MTFPCKEEVIFLEKLAKRQYKIYPDAADFGIETTKMDISIIRQVVANIREVFGCEEYKFKEEQWHNGKSVEFHIPIEEDYGYLYGMTIKLEYNSDPIRKKKFMSIDITNGKLWPA